MSNNLGMVGIENSKAVMTAISVDNEQTSFFDEYKNLVTQSSHLWKAASLVAESKMKVKDYKDGGYGVRLIIAGFHTEEIAIEVADHINSQLELITRSFRVQASEALKKAANAIETDL